MDHQVIIAIAYAVVGIIGYVLGKFVFPKAPKETIESITKGFELLVTYADKFVVWAKQFMSANSGEEKMDAVVQELAKVAERCGIKITENELKAIVQKAYEEMKRGESEALPVTTSGHIVVSDRLLSNGTPINMNPETTSITDKE